MGWGPFGLDGRVAIVTGAAQGIGFGIASRMREAGADVVVADLQGDNAAAAIERLRGVDAPGRLLAVTADVSDPATGERVVAEAAGAFGRVDVLVNNAGIYPVAPLADLGPDLVHKVLGVNVAGVIFMTKAASAAMAANGGGAVVNIASMDGLHPSFPGLSTYGASKGAVIALTKHHALELAPSNVRVNAIAPGSIWTEGAAASSQGGGLTEQERQAIEDAMLARLPIGRMGTPDDIATAAVFLASPASSYMTGETVLVDGGMLLT